MVKILRNNIDILIVSFILAALLLIVFKEVVFLDYVFVKRDISRYYYPLRKFAADTFKSGELPLWNPYLFCGIPLHAAIQNSVFYPLSLIYYLMDFTRGFGLFIILHVFLCGLFMYLFMKSCGISKWGSFLAALVFTFSGYIMSSISLTITLNSVTWFPLAMLVFLKGLKRPGYKFSILLGMVLTLMFLAGDPSVTIASFGIIFLVSAYLFTERLIRDKRADIFLIYNFLITSAVFFLLSSFQTLPAIEYYTRTARAKMGWPEASAWSVPYSDFFSLIIPYFNELSCYYQDYWVRQSWLDNYYLGITTIILAGFALRYRFKERLVQFLFVISLVSVAVCLGRHFIVYPALYKTIPFMRIIRYPVRFFFIFTFSICALAGIGLDSLKQAVALDRFKGPAKVFLITAFLASGLVVIITVFQEGIVISIMKKAVDIYQSNPSFNIQDFPSSIYADIFNLRRTLLYISSFGLFIFLWSGAKKKRLLFLTVFLLAGSDLIFANTGYEPLEKESYFKEPTENIRWVMKDKSLFRIVASPYSLDRFTKLYEKSYHQGIKSSKDRFVNNRMMEFGLDDMWGYDSTVLKRNLELAEYIYKSKTPADTNLLNLLNVKYVSSHREMNVPGYKKVSETPNAAVYLNTQCLPRALLLRDAVVMNKDEEILRYISSKKFNPGNQIILEEEAALPGSSRGPPRPFKTDKIDIIRYTPQIIELSVTAKEPAFLLLSDTYYPGWKAYLNGRLERIYRADFFLRTIKIPEGKNSVRFVYDPLSFKIGSAVSLISFLAVLLYLAVAAVSRQKSFSQK